MFLILLCSNFSFILNNFSISCFVKWKGNRGIVLSLILFTITVNLMFWGLRPDQCGVIVRVDVFFFLSTCSFLSWTYGLHADNCAYLFLPCDLDPGLQVLLPFIYFCVLSNRWTEVLLQDLWSSHKCLLCQLSMSVLLSYFIFLFVFSLFISRVLLHCTACLYYH